MYKKDLSCFGTFKVLGMLLLSAYATSLLSFHTAQVEVKSVNEDNIGRSKGKKNRMIADTFSEQAKPERQKVDFGSDLVQTEHGG